MLPHNKSADNDRLIRLMDIGPTCGNIEIETENIISTDDTGWFDIGATRRRRMLPLHSIVLLTRPCRGAMSWSRPVIQVTYRSVREAGTKRSNGYTAHWPRPSFPERRALFFRCQDNRAVWFDKRIVLDTRCSSRVPRSFQQWSEKALRTWMTGFYATGS